jgi:DSF synthase
MTTVGVYDGARSKARSVWSVPSARRVPLQTRRPAPAADLGALRQLETSWDEDNATLWTFMRPEGRPSFNPPMLRDFQAWQDGIVARFGSRGETLRYLVLGSRFPGVFCLGGDLALFADLIRRQDRGALVSYGRACVRILHRNMRSLDLPIVTIGLVQGDALGGGFVALMSFNVIVAERGAKFGLPETAFGLFPGMGAHSFLVRRLGVARAEQMILSCASYTAEQMYDLGLVQVLAEPGEGEAAVRAYIRQNRRRHSGQCAIYNATRSAAPLALRELEAIVDLWADAALRLNEQDLKLMLRLVAAQTRLLDRSANDRIEASSKVIASFPQAVLSAG